MHARAEKPAKTLLKFNLFMLLSIYVHLGAAGQRMITVVPFLILTERPESDSTTLK